MADKPTTGDGKKGGAKPKAGDCAQRLASGVPMIRQPSKGWGARIIADRLKRKR